MAKPKVKAGLTTEAVAANLRRLRADGRMSVRELSERSGRKLTPNAVSEIENGQRKVDVDDLVTLALALDVSPSTLLMPPAPLAEQRRLDDYAPLPAWAVGTYEDGDDTRVSLTDADETHYSAEAVWDWLIAHAPLTHRAPRDRFEREEWRRRSQPQFAWGRFKDG